MFLSLSMLFSKASQCIICLYVKSISFGKNSKKIVPDNARGMSTSYHDWLTRQLNGKYFRKNWNGKCCENACRLFNVNDRYGEVKPVYPAVDCSSKPDSWTQIANEFKLNQELEDSKPQKGIAVAVKFHYENPIKEDIIDHSSNDTHVLPSVPEDTLNLPYKNSNVILDVMVRKTPASYEFYSALLMDLNPIALKFSVGILMKDGTFLCKAWDEREVENLLKTLQSLFLYVKRLKPKASHSDASVLYLVAIGYKRKKK